MKRSRESRAAVLRNFAAANTASVRSDLIASANRKADLAAEYEARNRAGSASAFTMYATLSGEIDGIREALSVLGMSYEELSAAIHWPRGGKRG